MSTTILNFTPHPITVFVNGVDILINPQPVPARVAVTFTPDGSFCGIPLVKGTYGEVTGLPDPQEGTLLIVSAMVRAACPDRCDLVSPVNFRRDETGTIIGCEALEVN